MKFEFHIALTIFKKSFENGENDISNQFHHFENFEIDMKMKKKCVSKN